MPYSVSTSRFSFVQFEESDLVNSCNFESQGICLPVFDHNDAWFQFFVTAETEEEIDALCNGDTELTMGLAATCLSPLSVEFADKPGRNRLGANKVLFTWQNGVPGFDTHFDIGECFHIRVTIGDQSFCTNCFQRIGIDCHTSVLEYTNQENAFDFNYCGSADSSGGGDDLDCEPTEITFVNETNLVIPWTSFMQAKYGDTPSVQVWIQDTNGELVAAGLRVAMDTYPPTEIRIDLGGLASGIVKIMK